MDKSEHPGSRKADSALTMSHKNEKQKKPFVNFRKTVDRKLESIILKCMREFRDEMIKLKKRK